MREIQETTIGGFPRCQFVSIYTSPVYFLQYGQSCLDFEAGIDHV